MLPMKTDTFKIKAKKPWHAGFSNIFKNHPKENCKCALRKYFFKILNKAY